MSSVRQACRVMACVARQTPKTYPRGMPPSYAKTLALESLQKDCPPAYEELMKKEKLTTSSAMRDRAPTEHACSAHTIPTSMGSHERLNLPMPYRPAWGPGRLLRSDGSTSTTICRWGSPAGRNEDSEVPRWTLAVRGAGGSLVARLVGERLGKAAVSGNTSRSPLWSCWCIPHRCHTFLIGNISRSPLWSSWFISLLTSCTSNKEYKRKSSMELLLYFLTDFIHF